MKTFRLISNLAALSLFCVIACNKSTTSNPITPGSGSFTLVLGSTFQFQQWQLDTISQSKLPATMQYVHQRVSDSGLTIFGMANAYRVLDSTFDSTNLHSVVDDTLYFATSGTKLYEYGALANLFMLLTSRFIEIPAKWDLVANVGSSSQWLVDSTSARPAGLFPLLATLNGTDAGDVSLTVGSSTLSSNHVSNTGTIAVDTAPGKSRSINISGETYNVYNPAITGKLVIHPIINSTGSTNGLERDMISFTKP